MFERLKKKYNEIKLVVESKSIGKRGAVGIDASMSIIGLLVMGTVAVALMPTLLANFSSSTIWTGVGGTLVRTLVPILLVVVLIVKVLQQGGIKAGK